MLKKNIIYFLLFLCTAHSVQAAGKTSYFFKQISIEDGLNQTSVRATFYDSRGFLWIGTRSGLNRYDTYKLMSYKNDLKDDTLLPSNNVLFITEDKEGKIWVGTNKGITRFDYNTNQFEPLLHEGKELRIKSFAHVEGGILLGGAGVLYLYKTASIVPIQFGNREKVGDNITAIHQWVGNKYILSTRWDGMWVYDATDRSVVPTSFCSNKDIMSIYVDSANKLWVSPYGKGIMCYNEDGTLIQSLNVANEMLTNDVVLSIVEKDGDMWFGTDGGGIVIYNKEHATTSVLEYMPGDSFSFPSNSVLSLYVDRMNNIWAGTIRSGLVGIRQMYMRTYKDSPLQSKFGLSEKTVLSITEDQDAQVWIGTDGGGVNKFDPKTQKFKHFESTNKMKIVSLVDYDQQHLLISNFSKGVSLFNKTTGAISPFVLVDKETNKKATRLGISVNLLHYNSDSIYIFTDSIYLFSRQQNKFSAIHSVQKKSQNSFLQRLSRDKKYIYLFHEHHISRIDTKKLTLEVIHTLDNPATISTAAEGKNGELWIATSKELYLLHVDSKKIVRSDIPVNSVVSSLLYDNQGRLWIGTDKMLYTYIPNENRFVVYGDSDGAPANEYLFKPTLIGKDNSLYMGGVGGLLYVPNDIVLPKEITTPELDIADFTIDGLSSVLSQKNMPIQVPWSHSMISVRTLTKDKDIFREHIYRYTIEGKESTTIETHRKEITLYSLPVGTYRVLVSCNAQNGEWAEAKEVVNFQIYPPWWNTTWFYSLLVLLLLLTLVVVVWYIIQKSNNQLKLEKKEYERQSYEDKVKFLINVSHELRTPLTLIYAPLKRLMQGINKEDKMYTPLSQILSQAVQMNKTINMVLDIRKMEVRDDKLKLEEVAINCWISDIMYNFSSEASAKKIQLVLDADEAINNVLIDKEKTSIVLSNILMNALKFSPEETTITIKSELQADTIKISVVDQGIGLENVDQSQLFTRFYQGNHEMGGSGIGLSYSKKLIEMQNGTIGVDNNAHAGSTFWFTLPTHDEVAQTASKVAIDHVLSTLHTSHDGAEEDGRIDLSHYSVVVAEDDTNMQAFLKEALSDYFKEVYTSNNGAEALIDIKSKKPDIIISDVMMPRMNGYELCKSIKSNLEISHIPVILLTARTDDDSTSLGYKLGADMYLPKPFDIATLVVVLKNILEAREALKERYIGSATLVDPVKNTFSNSDESFILKLNKIIKDNIDNPLLDVPFITEQMGMSRASLYNKFKAITGQGINTYITSYRIEEACELLLRTQHTVGEISDIVGFNNQRYFSTVFKQAKGMSPTEYRKEQLGE